ncbi:hypothetical protein BH09BAC1_BH09BAC1_16050 [soil metagenome]
MKSIPVIIMSTAVEEGIIDQLYEKGAQYLICKPPEFSQLINIIQQTLTLISPENLIQPIREDFVLTLHDNLSV